MLLLLPVLGISGPEARAAFKLAAKAGVMHAAPLLLVDVVDVRLWLLLLPLVLLA